MKTRKLLGKLFFIALLTANLSSLFAQDTITFNWTGSVETKSFFITATAGVNNILVDWGNGASPQAISGNGYNTMEIEVAAAAGTYSNTNTYTVTITSAIGTNIYYFGATYEQISELDVSKSKSLKELTCFMNQLTELDISQNTDLERLRCHNNSILEIDISRNTAINYLVISSNQLTELDVSNNILLQYLDCELNQLEGLDVSKNIELINLRCVYNQISLLDVSQNLKLTGLDCSLNKITTLDLSKNTSLVYLNCSHNQLTELDLSQNTTLSQLRCKGNQLTLSQLYPISSMKSISTTRDFTPQSIYDTVSLNEGIDFRAEVSFGTPANITNFEVTLSDGSDATDKFVISNDTLTFKENGKYNVVVTNDSVRSGVSNENTVEIIYKYLVGRTRKLIYNANEGGSISGATMQEVVYGGNGNAVNAVPNSGYTFVQWSDEKTDNPRIDKNVTDDINVSAIFEVNTNINSQRIEQLVIYPNPFEDKVFITNDQCVERIVILNLMGQVIFDRQLNGETNIDTQCLNKGVYMFMLYTDNKRIVKRLVKE